MKALFHAAFILFFCFAPSFPIKYIIFRCGIYNLSESDSLSFGMQSMMNCSPIHYHFQTER